MCPYRLIDKHLPTIRKIPNDLWDKVKLLLTPEKLDKTIGRPVISFRKVLEGNYIHWGESTHKSS